MRIQVASLGAGVAQTSGGAVRARAPGTITLHSDGSPVSVWSLESGGVQNTTGAFLTDDYGRVPGWLDNDVYSGVQADISIPPAPVVTVVVGLTVGVAVSEMNNSKGVHAATQAAVPAHTGTETMTASGNGTLAVDGRQPFAPGDRILVKDEVNAAHNGIFTVVAPGSASTPWQLTRAPDSMTSGMGVSVADGSLNGGATLVLTTPGPITPGSTPLAFSSAPVGSPPALNLQNKFTRRQKIAISASARANLSTRPRPGLAPNLTPYTYDHATLTQANDYAGTNPVDGSGTALVGKAVLTSGAAAGFHAGTAQAPPDTVAVVPGDTLQASFWTQNKAGNTNTTARVSIAWLNAANGTISTFTGVAVTLVNGVWTLITCLPATAPALCTHAQVSFQAVASAGAVTGDTVWFDGCLIEKNVAVLGPYFDGASAGCSWAGTALASTSSSVGEDAYMRFRDAGDINDLASIGSDGMGHFAGIDFQAAKGINAADPTNAQDVVTKAYGDGHYGGGAAPFHSMPSKIYATTGREINVYWENFLRTGGGISIDQYQFDVTCAVGEQDEFGWFYTPIDADATAGIPWSVAISYNGVLLSTISTTLQISSSLAGGSVNRKLLIIGDSLSCVPLINTGIGWPAELIKLLSTDTHYAMTQVSSGGATVAGETDSAGAVQTVHSEAVSGKTFAYFQTDPASPFVFGGVLNFQTYLTNSAITLGANDWVLFLLGHNDVFGPTDDATVNGTNVPNAATALAALITGVKALATVPRIAVAMPLPPTHWQDGFGASYASGQTQARYARNRALMAERLRATYSDATVAGVTVLATHLGMDTRNGWPNSLSQVSARYANATDPGHGKSGGQYYKANNGLHAVGSHDGQPSTAFWQLADTLYAAFKTLA